MLKARPLQLGCYRSDKTEKKRGIGQTKYRDPAQERLLRSTNTHGLFSGEAGARGSQSYQCKKLFFHLYLKLEGYLMYVEMLIAVSSEKCIYNCCQLSGQVLSIYIFQLRQFIELN